MFSYLAKIIPIGKRCTQLYHHSPLIQKIEVTRRGKVRRAKLYYLRDRVGKASKVKENISK